MRYPKSPYIYIYISFKGTSFPDSLLTNSKSSTPRRHLPGRSRQGLPWWAALVAVAVRSAKRLGFRV